MNRVEPEFATGSWLAPSWEHATVRDAMSAPVIVCPSDTPLTTVARTMATRHVHAVVVTDDDSDPVAWRVVSDRAMAEAGAAAADRTVGDVAERPSGAERPRPTGRSIGLHA